MRTRERYFLLKTDIALFPCYLSKDALKQSVLYKALYK